MDPHAFPSLRRVAHSINVTTYLVLTIRPTLGDRGRVDKGVWLNNSTYSLSVKARKAPTTDALQVHSHFYFHSLNDNADTTGAAKKKKKKKKSKEKKKNQIGRKLKKARVGKTTPTSCCASRSIRLSIRSVPQGISIKPS